MSYTRVKHDRSKPTPRVLSCDLHSRIERQSGVAKLSYSSCMEPLRASTAAMRRGVSIGVLGVTARS